MVYLLLTTSYKVGMRRTKGLLYKVLSLIVVAWTISFGFPAYAKEIKEGQTIKMVQAALNSEGYDCGTADGVVGKKTKRAIKKYQKANGLDVDGKITDTLVSELEITEDMLKGVTFYDFVKRYNASVNSLNSISGETGDPTIQQISDEDLQTGSTVLDEKTSLRLVTDERQISISGVSLARDTNQYDIPMVYELVSISYAMDNSFSDVNKAIDFVGTFVEDHLAGTDRMNYGIWNHEGTIFFTIIQNINSDGD